MPSADCSDSGAACSKLGFGCFKVAAQVDQQQHPSQQHHLPHQQWGSMPARSPSHSVLDLGDGLLGGNWKCRGWKLQPPMHADLQ